MFRENFGIEPPQQRPWRLVTSYIKRGHMQCPKLEDLRIKYMALDRMRPNVYNFVHMLQDDDPDTIYSLAKFAFHGLKLMYYVDLQDYVLE